MSNVVAFPTARRRPYRSPAVHTLAEMPPNVVRLGAAPEPESFPLLRRTPELAMVVAITFAIARHQRDPSRSFWNEIDGVLERMTQAGDGATLHEARRLFASIHLATYD